MMRALPWGSRLLPASFLLALGGCHLLLPFSPNGPQPLAEAGPEIGPEVGPPRMDLDPCGRPCTTTNLGQCDPCGDGEVCMAGGAWRVPPCPDPPPAGFGCGNPLDTSPDGFCDPKWSECVTYDSTKPQIASCNALCEARGKRCCDSGTCSGQDLCITSRNYGHPGFSYWGQESWATQEACEDPMEVKGGYEVSRGQNYCDARNPGKWQEGGWFRCCCI